MNVSSDGNWFGVDRPASTPAAAVGAEMLATRAALVVERLPDAAEHADQDVEHVHKLRVACRRASAVLHAFEPLAPRAAKKLSRWLKRIRRAAGPARDADVLLARFQEEHPYGSAGAHQAAERLEAERRDAQAGLVKLRRSARHGEFELAAARFRRALVSASEEKDAPLFAEFGRRAIAEALAPVADFSVAGATLPELHGLRIAAKRLRYSLELFQDALPPGVARAAYPDVEELQERLGQINDRHSAQDRFQGWIAGMPADETAAFVAGLVQSEWSAGERLRAEFLSWWTADRGKALVKQLSG